MITIAVANQKGGVGKTTLSFNFAQILAGRKGTKVLAIDNDPQGNLTSSFVEDPARVASNVLDAYNDTPVEPEWVTGSLALLGADIKLAPVAERDFQVVFKLKETLESLDGQFDYCIIDCLPSFGHLHLVALNAADYVLIPVKLAPYALAGMNDLFKTLEKARKYFNPKLKPLGIVINQFDGRRPVMERELEESLTECLLITLHGPGVDLASMDESTTRNLPMSSLAPLIAMMAERPVDEVASHALIRFLTKRWGIMRLLRPLKKGQDSRFPVIRNNKPVGPGFPSGH